MATEKPRKSLSNGKDSPKAKNPFSRVNDHTPEGIKNSSSMMRKSWSTDSLGLLSNSSRLGKTPCICAPTKHEGSFRCRIHRSSAGTNSSNGLAFAAPPLPTELDFTKSLLSSRVDNH